MSFYFILKFFWYFISISFAINFSVFVYLVMSSFSSLLRESLYIELLADSLSFNTLKIYCTVFPFSFLFSFWNSQYSYVETLHGVAQASELLFLYFILFFFMLFRLHNLCCPFFKFAEAFFHQLKSFVEPSI